MEWISHVLLHTLSISHIPHSLLYPTSAQSIVFPKLYLSLHITHSIHPFKYYLSLYSIYIYIFPFIIRPIFAFRFEYFWALVHSHPSIQTMIWFHRFEYFARASCYQIKRHENIIQWKSTVFEFITPIERTFIWMTFSFSSSFFLSVCCSAFECSRKIPNICFTCEIFSLNLRFML